MVKDIFNVKVYHYADKDHVRVYRKGVVCRDNRYVDVDGVIHELDREVSKELNPFTGEMEHMRDWDDERSSRVSMNRTINKVYELSRSNVWQYFFTMTFDGQKVDRYDYAECSERLSQWLKDTRKHYAPDMVYLVVPERHKDGAFHFHGLFSKIGSLPLTDSGIKQKGREIYNLPTYKYGFTTVSMVEDSAKASSYVTKYISKELCQVTFGKKRYWVSRNAKRPEVETMTIEGDLLSKLEKFDGHIEYMKTLDGFYQGVTYIELDCRIDELNYFR